MGTTHLDQLQVSGVPTMGVNPLPLANNYWFVSSLVGSNSFTGNSYTTPFATIAYACSQSGLAVGDCIVVMEGHTETVAAAAGIAQATAGVYVVGLGSGQYRPQVTFSTSTAATWTITAAGCSVSNIIGITGIDVLVSPWVISAAGCSLGTIAYGAVEWQDPSSSLQAVRQVLTTAAADKLNINLRTIGITSGGTSPVNAVRLVGVDSAVINLDFYGRASTAVVEFLTTACSNIEVYGYMYNSGVTNYTKDVVDTVTGSTWFASFSDGAAGIDISGGSGSALGPAQAATVIADLSVATADGTANTYERDVIGNKTDANIYVPGTTNSLAAYIKGHSALQERVALKSAAVMTNGLTLFTVAGGPIEIMALVSICATANDATASTLQYSVTPTVGSAQTISGASASLANATAGASVTLAGTALATAALYNANGPNLIANPGTIMAPAGTITAVIGTGSTTGTWTHYIRYKPLAVGVTVS